MKNRTGLIFAIFIAINIAEIFMERISILRYWDELLAVLSLAFLILNSKGKIKIKGFNGTVLCSIFVIFLVGILGNVLFGNQDNSSAIMLDILANFKLPLCCAGLYSYSRSIDTGVVLTKIRPYAMTFVVISLMSGIVSQFVDIGMRGQYRYGLWGFNFIYGYAHVFAMLLLSCLVALSYDKKRRNKVFWIVFWSIVVELLMTLKGISFGTCVAMVIIAYVYMHRSKISFGTVFVMAFAALGAGWIQIKEYFLGSTNAPRMMLLKYGYKTMLKYFPIGGGFASFGSDMAAKYYSKLYYTYGFNLNWGTREGSQYLNDSWWPIVMGQFGVIGLIFVLILLYRLFAILQNRIRIRTCKIAVISALVYMLVASVGTTIFTTSATIILCVNLVLVANAINYEENLDVAK